MDFKVTVLRLSVCLSSVRNILWLTVRPRAKVTIDSHRKLYLRNRLAPKWIVYRSYQGHVNHCVTFDVTYFGNR